MTIAFIFTADAVLIEGIFYGGGTSRRSFAIARESTKFFLGKRCLAAILTLLRFGNSQVSMPSALNGIARTGITCGDWIVASDKQRSDWLAALPAEAQLFAPKPGQKPRTAFLGKLREIINTEVRAAA